MRKCEEYYFIRTVKKEPSHTVPDGANVIHNQELYRVNLEDDKSFKHKQDITPHGKENYGNVVELCITMDLNMTFIQLLHSSGMTLTRPTTV